MQKRVKKRYVTLLEMLIAMSLVSVLLVFLFGFYREMDLMQSHLAVVQKENFKLLYVQKRLSNVIMEAGAIDKIIGKRRSLLYTPQTDLVLIYDNHVNRLPYFSNYVLGRLYVDKDKNLCLSSWPSPEMWKEEGFMIERSPINKEVLLRNVEKLSFEFFVPPIFNDLVVDPEEVGTDKKQKIPKAGGWLDEWSLEYDQLPAMVKVILKIKEDKKKEAEQVVFVFPIANYYSSLTGTQRDKTGIFYAK